MGSSNKEFEEDEKKTDRPYLIDASALYPLLLRIESSTLLRKIRVLDLTKYEIGNAARYDKNLPNAARMMELWAEIFASLEEERPVKLAEVQRLATKHSITFYDAAYVQTAINLGTKLITMDREILRKFNGQTITLNEFEKIIRI